MYDIESCMADQRDIVPPSHTADQGRTCNLLPQGLADSLLQLLSLFCGERLVDADHETLVELVDELVITRRP